MDVGFIYSVIIVYPCMMLPASTIYSLIDFLKKLYKNFTIF